MKTLAWLVFRCPGAVILWIRYHFPGKGQVYVSARQRGVPIIEVMFSLGFWLVAGVILTSMINKPEKTEAPANPVVVYAPPVEAPRTQTPAPSTTAPPRVTPAQPVAPAQPLPPHLARQLVQLINEQVYKCWNVPGQALNTHNPPVPRVEIILNRDGSLLAQPRVLNQSSDPLFSILASSALQAVKRCAPLRIPTQYAAFYDDWKTVNINFNAVE